MSRAAKSRQAAALAVTEAADALLAWLRTQPRKADTDHRASEEPPAPPAPHAAMDQASAEPAPAPDAPVSSEPAEIVVPDDPAPDSDWRHRHAPQRLAHPDWLFHRLSVSGSQADLAAFRAAAVGAGTIPWQLDLARMEEDFFHLLIAPPRSLSLTGARILAGQLRAAVAERHALAMTQVGQSQACPFDLHALVPVPAAMLQRGPDDAAALAWLWQHWGTTQALRHVAIDTAAETAMQRALAPREATFVVTFWSADWTPWRALVRIAVEWPRLRFETRPIYEVP
jgi:hypothetical protein